MGAQRRGFTLIELLVVIAIIGILAAMLFPVFARARESARKTQCLANVKNIAIAYNMYMVDYDRGVNTFENRSDAAAYFDGIPGGGDKCLDDNGDPDGASMASRFNPYLRREVLLDDYIKNRDVWRCPSSKIERSPEVIVSNSNWLAEYQAHEGVWGADGFCPKDDTFPPGWGGAVTDTFVQNAVASDAWGSGAKGERAFSMGIGVNYNLDAASTSQFQDAADTVVCHDNGPMGSYTNPGMMAYPDMCAADCSGEYCNWAGTGNEACEGSTWGTGCAMYPFLPFDGANWTMCHDRERFKKYTRHLGGSNIGFLDGHAKWMPAQAIIAKVVEEENAGNNYPMGMETWGGGDPVTVRNRIASGECTGPPTIPVFYK